jgi:bacteriorhodopsin
MNLVTLTQAMFMLGFVAMAAGTFYFVLERGELKSEGRTSATYAALITFIAAILYWQMKDMVGFPNPGDVTWIAHTMPVRYLDWVLTTPLLLIEFGLIAGLAGAEKGLTYRLVLADIVMIVTGYFGEVGVAGSAGNYVNFILSTIAWAYIAYTLWQLKPTKGSAAVNAAVSNMKKFVIFGWLVYPIGTAVQQFLELNNSDAEITKLAVCSAAIIYVIADVINKVGFGIFALKAFKKN